MVLMDAVIVAAGRLSDPTWIAAGCHNSQKALLPFAGRPLLQRVLDACGEARSIRRVVVVGIDGLKAFDAPDALFLPDTGSIAGNVSAGARQLAAGPDAGTHAVVIACDLPLITGPMLDWLVAQADNDDFDFHYTVIHKDSMEARFPGSRRTFYRVRDGIFCGGDAHVLSFRLIDRLLQISSQYAARRKNPFQLAWLAGPVFTLRFFAGLESHTDICHRVERLLGFPGRVVVSKFPELGMDIDKPEHLRAILDATA
jgi:CTP:molybdopterin cytidylyltransferase MocA